MANIEFKLPDIGEGVHEGEIVRWIVAEGSAVAEDDPIVEVMTDKATVEIPAPQAGVVSKQLVAEGEVAKVGDVIFHIQGEGGEAAPAAPAPETTPASAGKGAPVAPAAPTPATPPISPTAASTVAVAASPASGAKVLAAPATRRLARELGVDLGTLTGTGKNGRIRPADVRNAGVAPAATSATPTPAAPAVAVATPPAQFPTVLGARDIEEIPFRGIRRKTAEAMSRSKFTAPHFSLIEEVDCTALLEARKRARQVGERRGIKITLMPYIMKAVASALQEFPQLNAELDEEAGVIRQKKFVNLGIAVDTPTGLMVPVVPDCHLKGILQLAAELVDTATRAREGKVRPDDFKDSTFTISNAGNIGGVLATPIINYPEVAILGVHSMRKMPRCVGDDIVARQVMNLSISIDHRVVDGADGARFIVRLREMLEDPSLILL